MAFTSPTTKVYILLTIILAIVYPFFEWRLSLRNYNESRIDSDFNRQLYRVLRHTKQTDKRIEVMQVHDITRQRESEVGFNLLCARYSAILSNYIYALNHDTFEHSNDALTKDSLHVNPHNFPSGFNLIFLQLRTENDVKVKWALIEDNRTDTFYLVLCGTDFLVDMLIDVSISPFPLTYSAADIHASRSFTSIFKAPGNAKILADNFLVHGGISGSIQWMYRNITSVLDQVFKQQQPSKLIVCGHSLGGGYATVLSMRLISLYHTISDKHHIQLFTFGAPSVLSSVMAANAQQHPTLQILHNNTFNFVHRFDVIPRLLGAQFSTLYPQFLWDDELLLNQIMSFKPVGKYFILHDRNALLYGIDASTHDLLSEHILRIIPRALTDGYSDSRTKLPLWIFRFLFGATLQPYVEYLLWLSFSAYPMVTDHSMDKYLSFLGDFSSPIMMQDTESGDMFCLNAVLQFVRCDEVRKTNQYELHWRLTQYGQLQNIASKQCVWMDWRLGSIWQWTFEYSLRRTNECGTQITKLRYLNGLNMFKIASDEHVDDYDTADAVQWMATTTTTTTAENDEWNDSNEDQDSGDIRHMKGLCLGCNISTHRLSVYQCNKTYSDIEGVLYFNPTQIVSSEGDEENRRRQQAQTNIYIPPEWQFWRLFDDFFLKLLF